MTQKTAQEFIEELVRDVQPPKGVAIVLRERKPSDALDTNWLTGAGVMPMDAIVRYDSAVAELRRQYPRVDWDGIIEKEGEWRRIARYLSEV